MADNERTAEDWGRIAVSLPGWRWMQGMAMRAHNVPRGFSERVHVNMAHNAPASWEWPNPDDPATAGCLLALLGRPLCAAEPRGPAWWITLHVMEHPDADDDGMLMLRGNTLGRACIAAAEALGRWPGGEQ